MRVHHAAWVIGVTVLILAGHARSAPTLFSGNITLTSGYRGNFYTPSGPDPSDYGAIFEHVGAPLGTLSVTMSGALTLPPSTFTDHFTSVVGPSFPGYPHFAVWNSRTQKAGSFAPGFLTTITTVQANTTSSPNLTMWPRQGMIRLKPGAVGFGGYMGIYENVLYSGSASGQIGIYRFSTYFRGTPGDDPLGDVSANAVTGMRTQITNSNIFFTIEGVGTNAPWITGTLTITQMDGAYSTVRTVTGMDARTSPYEGTVSLVSARLLNLFNRTGTTIQNKREGWARTTRINLVLPEPRRLALLAAGLSMLWGLRGRAL